MRRVVLLLAHDGVTQPRAWEVWETKAVGAVRVAVHCPKGRSGAFETRKRLRIPFGPTRWGALSIVRETVAALKQIVIEEGERVLVALVSGDTVPVLPFPNGWPETTMLFETRVHSADGIGKCYGHSQWLVISGEDIAHCVRVFEDDRALDVLLRHAYDECPFCPDNFFFGEALDIEPSPDRSFVECAYNEPGSVRLMLKRTPLEAFAFGLQKGGVTSPLTWSSATRFVANEHLDRRFRKPGPWCLRRILLEMKARNSAPFFRKVAPHAFFPSEFWETLYGDGHVAVSRALVAEEREAEAIRASPARLKHACEIRRALLKHEIHRQDARGSVYVGTGEWFANMLLLAWPIAPRCVRRAPDTFAWWAYALLRLAFFGTFAWGCVAYRPAPDVLPLLPLLGCVAFWLFIRLRHRTFLSMHDTVEKETRRLRDQTYLSSSDSESDCEGLP